MGTRGYFDGSGLSAPTRIEVLCCLCGSDTFWFEFNRRWEHALQELGMPVWHTTDVLRKRPGAMPGAVPAQLLNVIGTIAGAECHICSIAVDKEAHAALRRTYPTVPQMEDLCVGFCFRKLGIAKSDVGQTACLHLFFDRGEPFLHYLNAPWQRERRRARRHGGWPAQVGDILPAAAQDHPGLQAADLIAWGVRMHHESRQQDPRASRIIMMTLLTGKHYHGFLDEEALERFYVRKEHLTFALRYDMTR
jgi:hypothetical protein